MYTSHSLYLFLSLAISLSLTIFPRSSGHSPARTLASDKIQRARNSSHFKPNLTCVSSKCNAEHLRLHHATFCAPAGFIILNVCFAPQKSIMRSPPSPIPVLFHVQVLIFCESHVLILLFLFFFFL